MSEEKNKNQSRIQKFADYVLIIGGKIGNQRHMVAIRDGFGTFFHW